MKRDDAIAILKEHESELRRLGVEHLYLFGSTTGPLNYLVLIGVIDLLPKLFEHVFSPVAVQAELLDPDAPMWPCDAA